MNPILSALAVFIQPMINYAEQKLESVGAAFSGTLVTIASTLTNDQRIIGANCTAYWHAQYNAAVTAGETPLAAIGTASAHTLGEFIKEEGQEGSKVVQMTVTGLELAIENGIAS